ncbi:patatin-like phospholipase family protein [Fulvivirga ligni]|uniref:patatin-like phospholipase family protein n=1 Tax=Fulvivirga ligni TaxID=2904246 RepID=UPI001F40E6C7|nr:patatin-like phospholipase family protein [Fulvivirga ligni]UII19334.1 patatin-like phospholipase family protein [Fulvivirga ligni]
MNDLLDHSANRALVLAGGGMRVAYQAGILMALSEAGYQFNHVDGTSGGIFNTAMLASGLDSRNIAERWRTLNIKWFNSLRAFKNYLKPFKMQGYADADNIRDKVFPHMGIDFDKIKQSPYSYNFNVCNFSKKSVETIAQDQVTREHLLAGVSLPILMPALKIGDDWYIDAVWVKDANVLHASRKGVKEIWLVWAIGNNHHYLNGAFNQYVHMIEMSAGGALLQEFDHIKSAPELDVKLHVLKPDFPLPLDPDLFFNKIDARSLINMGYADAKNYLKEMKAEGVPMDESATKMKEPGTRLNIHAGFNGMIEWKGQLQLGEVFCYYRLSKIDGELFLKLFGSLRVGEEEYPFYQTNTAIAEVNGIRYLISKGSLTIEGEGKQVIMKVKAPGAFDAMIGLSFKEAELEIGAGAQSMSTIKMTQSIGSRLKNAFRMNVLTAEGTHGSFSTKFNMINQLQEI